MNKYRKCISCLESIFKSAKTHPYLCRGCEKELEIMNLTVPIYNKRVFKH